MVGYFEFVFTRDLLLLLFDHFVVKFLHLTAFIADDMVMVMSGTQLEYRCAALEVVPGDKSRGFKLGEYSVCLLYTSPSPRD